MLLLLALVAACHGVSFTSGRYRATQDGAAEFDWSGVSFEVEFRCPTAAAVLWFNISSSQDAAALAGHTFKLSTGEVFSATPIKAAAPTLFSVALSVAPATVVRVEVTKITEALFGIVTLHSVLGGGGCKVIDPFPRKAERAEGLAVEFIGDSLTCGYGVLGVSPCAFSASTEDVLQGFAGQLVKPGVVGKHSFVSWSGKGVVRNYGGSPGPTMQQLWPLTIANDLSSTANFSLFQPDVVVVVLGANDFSTPPQPAFETFQTGFNAILDRIESSYPHLRRIIVSCGADAIFCFNDYQERVVSARNDPKVSFVSMKNCWPDMNYPSKYTGCDGHPSVLGASYMAAILEKALLQQ
jgi:lysophospholipase L1-like esterase